MKFDLATGNGLILHLLSVTGKLQKYLQVVKTPNNFVMSKEATQIYHVCFVLFYLPYFILHSRESELYRYTLDGKSALAWELPFSRFMGHLSSTSSWGVLLSALPKDTTSELAGLFSTISPKCRAPSWEAVDAIFLSLLV